MGFLGSPGCHGLQRLAARESHHLGELDEALAKAANADTGVYIDIDIDPYECPRGAEDFYTLTGAFFGMQGRKWEDWLEELAAKKK